MLFELNSARTSAAGRDAYGDLKLDRPSFDSGALVVVARGPRTPSSHNPPTDYELKLDFDTMEIALLFKKVVEASDKSEDFKRVAHAVVDEFLKR